MPNRLTSTKGMIYLMMPKGMNYTENTEYKITIPPGIMKDASGNTNNVSHSSYKFKTISGKNSYAGYSTEAKPATAEAAFPMSAFRKLVTVNDTVKPTLVSSWPPAGASDVLTGTNVMLFFSEPVMWNYSHPGVISVVNNTASVSGIVATINITEQGKVLGPESQQIRMATEGSRQ